MQEFYSGVSSYKSHSKTIIANGDKLDILHKSGLLLSTRTTFHVSNVLLVPRLTTNLISVVQLVDDGNNIIFLIKVVSSRTNVLGKGRNH